MFCPKDPLSMAPPLRIPHIDPSLYSWHPSTKAPNLYLRHSLGAETKWACQALGPRQMFLSGRLSLTSPYSDLTLENFGRAAERAWLRLQSEFPEVLLGPSSEQGEDGSLLLELRYPGSDGEVRKWAERSFFLDTYEDGKSVEEEMKQAVTKNPVCVRLNASVNQKRKVTGAEFAFRVDHMTADGVGAYMLAACFFKFLAHAVSGREETFDWEASNGKLPTPWVGMMNSEQRTEGKEFEEGVTNLTNLVMEAGVGIFHSDERGFCLTNALQESQWGMKVLSKDGYMPKAIHQRFSVEESKAILLAVKEKLGKSCSVTHLGHAAMVMTMLKFKPVQERPTPGARLVSPLFINGRRYLDRGVPRSQSYISLCRAFSAIEFRDVENYIIPDSASKEEIQGKLKLACAEAFRSYRAVRDQKSLLTESLSMAEYMTREKYIQTTVDRGISY